MTKLGIMSFAHLHADGYAAAINTLEDVQLTAIWDDTPRRGRAKAKAFKTEFVKSLDEFLARDIEGVIICSENTKHRAMAERAAAAGKWILCEKPLAPSAADAHAMRSAAKKHKVGLGTAFPCRFSPPLMMVRDQVRAGQYGEIYAASCTNHGSMPGGWFTDEKLSGGGAVMDHTVHVADLLRWMLGKEFTKVYCEAGNLFHGKKLEVDDLGCLHLEMEGGVQVSHIASWSRPASFPTWGDVTMELIGEKGTVFVDAFRQKLDVYSNAASKAEWAPYGGNMDLGLVADFVASIRERRDPCASALDGIRATEVTVAAYRSLAQGKPVSIQAG
jgi:predicted dehydrogenase